MGEVAKQEAPQRSLVKKLAEIMGEVERVAKNGTNASQGYKYATEADIAAAVREGMAKRYVMLIPSVLDTQWDKVATRNGGELKLCTLKVRFTLEDGESGETRVYDIMGQGTDNGDKATYKAMTGAEKYALLKLFLIPTGDDPEKDEPEPPRRRAPEATKPPPPAKPAHTETRAGLKDRTGKLWGRAKGLGLTPDQFKDWCTHVLQGANPDSETITAQQVSALEAAWEAKFSGGAK